MKSKATNILAATVPAFLLLVATFSRQPYGFYTFLRIAVCASAIYLSWYSNQINKGAWLWIFVFVALLFNPVIPVHLTRNVWVLIDLATALVFVSSIVVLRKKGESVK